VTTEEIRTMMTRFKQATTVLGFMLAISAAGVLLGSAVSPRQLQAAMKCEQDECEARVTCVDNPGQNTGCSKSGSNCTTYGC
jgi:hypothetical protein